MNEPRGRVLTPLVAIFTSLTVVCTTAAIWLSAAAFTDKLFGLGVLFGFTAAVLAFANFVRSI